MFWVGLVAELCGVFADLVRHGPVLVVCLLISCWIFDCVDYIGCVMRCFCRFTCMLLFVCMCVGVSVAFCLLLLAFLWLFVACDDVLRSAGFGALGFVVWFCVWCLLF